MPDLCLSNYCIGNFSKIMFKLCNGYMQQWAFRQLALGVCSLNTLCRRHGLACRRRTALTSSCAFQCKSCTRLMLWAYKLILHRELQWSNRPGKCTLHIANSRVNIANRMRAVEVAARDFIHFTTSSREYLCHIFTIQFYNDTSIVLINESRLCAPVALDFAATNHNTLFSIYHQPRTVHYIYLTCIILFNWFTIFSIFF